MGRFELMQQQLADAASDKAASAVGKGDKAASSDKKGGNIDTYPDWLKTLSADPEWDSTQDQVQERHLANSAVPYSQTIGSLQGKDFAGDVVRLPLPGLLHVLKSRQVHVSACAAKVGVYTHNFHVAEPGRAHSL
jgi:hypothetical protein